MIIIGLIVLIAAVVVGVAGVMTNSGDAHLLTDDFAVFGYHVTGSTGMLLLYGIVIGAVGMFGLSLLLAGARRNAHRDRVRGATTERREITHPDADQADGPDPAGASRAAPAGDRSRRRPFWNRPAGRAHR